MLIYSYNYESNANQMSQYTIDFSCNHTESRNIVGKEKDRQGKADWMARGVCSDCYKQQLAAERQKEQSAQMATAAQFTLANLQGSEKQIAWAEKIRAKMIVEIEKFKLELTSSINSDTLTEIEETLSRLYLKILEELIAAIGLLTKSTWFIDNRDVPLTGNRALIKQLVPDCDDQMAAITAEEDAQIEQERQQEATIEQELAALELQKTKAEAALTAQQDAIAPEYDALQAISLDRLRQNLEAIKSKIREQQRKLNQLNA
jgi:hypothetical protein